MGRFFDHRTHELLNSCRSGFLLNDIDSFLYVFFVGFGRIFLAEAEGRRCHYPSWFLAHNRWQTLDGRWIYNLHKNSTLRITNITTHGSLVSAGAAFVSSGGSANGGGVDSRQEQKAVCQSVLDLPDNAARVVVHLSQGWCVSCHVS